MTTKEDLDKAIAESAFFKERFENTSYEVLITFCKYYGIGINCVSLVYPEFKDKNYGFGVVKAIAPDVMKLISDFNYFNDIDPQVEDHELHYGVGFIGEEAAGFMYRPLAVFMIRPDQDFVKTFYETIDKFRDEDAEPFSKTYIEGSIPEFDWKQYEI